MPRHEGSKQFLTYQLGAFLCAWSLNALVRPSTDQPEPGLDALGVHAPLDIYVSMLFSSATNHDQ